MHDSTEFFTKTQALKVIEDVVGFPRPQARYLSGYFDVADGELYIPKVDFLKLAEEIKKRDLIRRMGEVRKLEIHDQRRQAVMMEISSVIKSYMTH
jgi:hypothetical protein